MKSELQRRLLEVEDRDRKHQERGENINEY